jgi:hypothetical protein
LGDLNIRFDGLLSLGDYFVLETGRHFPHRISISDLPDPREVQKPMLLFPFREEIQRCASWEELSGPYK